MCCLGDARCEAFEELRGCTSCAMDLALDLLSVDSLWLSLRAEGGRCGVGSRLRACSLDVCPLVVSNGRWNVGVVTALLPDIDASGAEVLEASSDRYSDVIV